MYLLGFLLPLNMNAIHRRLLYKISRKFVFSCFKNSTAGGGSMKEVLSVRSLCTLVVVKYCRKRTKVDRAKKTTVKHSAQRHHHKRALENQLTLWVTQYHLLYRL
jgi:hypothetical protein